MKAESANFGTVNDPVSNSYGGLEIVEGYPMVNSGPQTWARIGKDDRIEVPETRVYPYRCICSLEILAADSSSWTGTGWLVSPRTVITAGHCVYRHANGGQVTQVEVIPGRDGPEPPYRYNSCISKEFAWAEMWKKEAQHAHDYGAIFLPNDCRFGDKLGYFGYADLTTEQLGQIEVCLSGYPSDKKLESTQWYHVRRLNKVTETSLRHKIDTFEGHSGAPLWHVEGDENRHVVGIHNAGSSFINHATRINDAVFQQIKDWRVEGS